MKKIKYRCNRCMTIEERLIVDSSQQATNSTPCQKCGGLAIRLPIEKWKDKIFEDFVQKPNAIKSRP